MRAIVSPGRSLGHSALLPLSRAPALPGNLPAPTRGGKGSRHSQWSPRSSSRWATHSRPSPLQTHSHKALEKPILTARLTLSPEVAAEKDVVNPVLDLKKRLQQKPPRHTHPLAAKDVDQEAVSTPQVHKGLLGGHSSLSPFLFPQDLRKRKQQKKSQLVVHCVQE